MGTFIRHLRERRRQRRLAREQELRFREPVDAAAAAAAELADELRQP
jgi:hypothetical protein